MRNACAKLVCAVLCLGLTAAAQNAPKESRLRIGILDLETPGDNEELARKAGKLLTRLVGEVGFYEVLDQEAIREEFEKIDKEFPRICRDPRCVVSVGNSARCDRMIYGSVAKNGTSYGTVLTLMDVVARRPIEHLSIEGEPGVGLEALLKAAVAKLHGQPEEDLNVELNSYYGPEVHQEKQLIVSSGIWAGVAFFYAMANGVFKGVDEFEKHSDELAGVPSRAYHIPLHARPNALAHAYTAASNDAYGVFYNPAGVAWVGGGEAVASYQYRYGMDNIAASFVNKATRELGFGHAFLYNGDREHLYSEATLATALAYKFDRTLPFLRPFSVGAGLKVINTRYKPGGENLEFSDFDQRGHGFGVGLDLGLRAELSEKIYYGLVFKDVPSFVMEKNMKRGVKYVEFNPSVLQMGGLFKAGYATQLFAQGQVPLHRDQAWKMAGAVEHCFFGLLNARIGVRKEILAGFQVPWVITGGFGLEVNTEKVFGEFLTIDGAYEFNQFSPFSNPLSFSFRFGF